MTPLQLDEIRGLVARHKAAIGPGGEKAWLDAQLARSVPSLVAEIDRLRALYDDQRRIIARLLDAGWTPPAVRASLSRTDTEETT